ncbi:MAG: hypothetical protein AAB352_00705 [Patescibacteria group bacterium]
MVATPSPISTTFLKYIYTERRIGYAGLYGSSSYIGKIGEGLFCFYLFLRMKQNKKPAIYKPAGLILERNAWPRKFAFTDRTIFLIIGRKIGRLLFCLAAISLPIIKTSWAFFS